MANFVSYADAQQLMTNIGNKLKAMNGAYVIKGNSTFSGLATSLTKAMNGYVYNVTDDFTTTVNFVEGAGKKYPAGTNVVIVNIGTDQSPIMKYDAISSFVDVDAIYAEIEKISDMISVDDFDNTQAYQTGDIVKYENKLYVFTKSHSAGNWNASDVESVTVVQKMLINLDTKVDKITGKGLSTKDYTTAEKTKLSEIDEHATAVGKNVTGTKYTINGSTVTASNGAEIFNNYTDNKALGIFSHAEGSSTTASGSFSHAEGDTTIASGSCSHAEGSATTASGVDSHAEGQNTTASGQFSHAEGYHTIASGPTSHAEGQNTTASDNGSHAEGYGTTALRSFSHAEGGGTTASGNGSHAEGFCTTASGNYSHAEGKNTTASGPTSHAEGQNTTASDNGSHAEGYGTTASRSYSHAEGDTTIASGSCSHAEGSATTASGVDSHAEGQNTTASGQFSHAEGYHTIASGDSQHVQGRNNVEDKFNQYAFIIGNGTDDSNRSNAFAVDWQGLIYVNNQGGVDVSKMKTIWTGTQSEYQQLTSTNEYDFYCIYEEDDA